MVTQDLSDCLSPRLCPPASCSNQRDTNHCTIPRRCPPCRRDHNHSAKTISPAQYLHNRRHQYPSLEIFPARCWPPISRWAEIHRPTRMFFLITRRAQQIQTRLQLTNDFPPISRKLLRPDKRSVTPDNFPCL